MRTPNTKCCICDKPLYRRPSEMAKYAASCCAGCRSEYYKTKTPSPNLELGREKGTNHLAGIPKSEESNAKRSKSIRRWCEENRDKVVERGAKCRGEKHYRWNGGISNLNKSIRQMNEYRRWQRKIKKRDCACAVCGDCEKLEAHHIVPIKEIIENSGIKTREDARNCSELWDVENGMTLCVRCHYKLHGRRYDND